MKKTKLIAAFAAAAVLAVGGGVLAGCNTTGGHKHTYSTDWTKTISHHYHVAACDDLKEGDEGYTKDYAEHEWGDDYGCDICEFEGTHVMIDKTELKFGVNYYEEQLNAYVIGGGEVVWSSDNTEVVTVNAETGYVEAGKPGTATITATLKDGTDTATCAVTVAEGYYIIGGMDSAWNKVGGYGQDGVIYFKPTDTEGVYKTDSFELIDGGNFQIAKVGDTSGDWWKDAINQSSLGTAEGNVLVPNGDSNIGVEKHGKYTVTLDLTGEEPVVTGICDEEIDDSKVEKIYYLIGLSDVVWTPAEKAEDVAEGRTFTNNGDGTYSLTIKLQKGWEFKALTVGRGYTDELGESAVPRDKIGTNGTATVDTAYKLTWTSSTNIGVGLTGMYTITITPDGGTNNQLDYTFTATDDTEVVEQPIALYYYIKGDAQTGVQDDWNSPVDSTTALTKTGDDVYTGTFHLVAGNFMFYSYAEYADDGNEPDGLVEAQYDYFNNGNSTFTAADDCVAASGDNFAVATEGWYTVTINRATKTLTFSYSATNPDVTPDIDE